jgi:hypothetical protein
MSPKKKEKLIKNRRNTFANIDYFDSFNTYNQIPFPTITKNEQRTKTPINTFSTNPSNFQNIGPMILKGQPGFKKIKNAKSMLKTI